MKRMIGYLLLCTLFIFVFCLIYVHLFQISLAFIIGFSLFLCLYASLLGVCWKSMERLYHYEQKAVHFGLQPKDENKILFFSLTTLAPMFLCDCLVSLIPLYTYEVWFITVFPWVTITCFPAISVMEEYRGLTHKRLPFFSLFALLSLVCCLLGTTASHLLFS